MTIVALPGPRKGRRRIAASMDAAGECSIIRLKQNGENVPANVSNIKDKRLMPAQTPELALFIAILGTMNYGQISDIRKNLKAMTMAGNRSAELAYNLLDLQP
jgi:hypothetical protein